MREVEVSRFVRATPAEVRRALTPTALVEYEGSFSVVDVEERDDATVVTAGSRGLGLALRFEERDGTTYYTQGGDAGPFDAMETWVTVRAEDDGSRVTIRSAVSLGLPLPNLTDRLAAWKRKGELKRALSSLSADLG
ncbi:Polyketide cyclase / dehydrase and lipid transport [Halogranum gelatinilyticum]|uniref:Polyketide cyclase / dehydrase and lipid transport n=1 Tax=Halogranum gelatinilyticum TaxID=660521 RepID=A0A1G9NSV5_9EURY|nr:SRPBCC family protein [Halogranum gelatinilyticum]SDL89107.1 Polyketide cyclase / dehydrase and lipid transport [Halogranum gelatinilyticum]